MPQYVYVYVMYANILQTSEVQSTLKTPKLRGWRPYDNFSVYIFYKMACAFGPHVFTNIMLVGLSVGVASTYTMTLATPDRQAC